MRKQAIAAALALTLSGGLAACSSDSGGSTSSASGVMSDMAKSGATMAQSVGLMGQDAKFLTTAIQAGIAEVEMGRLARERTSNRQVRQFAQMMIDDHSNANAQLEALARAQDLTIPTEMDSTHQSLKEQLAALDGRAFDRAYIDNQVADHETVVALFTERAATDTDPVAQLAQRTLPKLRQHLEMARDIQEELGPARVSMAE
jgi:putative membrane protein